MKIDSMPENYNNLIKQDNKTSDYKLPIVESFYTIQGEGAFAGSSAYFIRLAGCDIGCVWCDTKNSWEIEDHQYQNIEDIASKASKYSSRISVITGGEPLMHDLDPLCSYLKKHQFRIHIETSGAYALSGNIDWLCFSPKKFKTTIGCIL